MRIGPKREEDPGDKYTLYDWAIEGNRGIIGYEFADQLPSDMYEFCAEQYKRFGIHMPDDWWSIIEAGAWGAFMYLDHDYPYALMHTSNIKFSEIQFSHTIDLIDPNIPGWSEEADIDKLEVFEPNPDYDVLFFNESMYNPGLENLYQYPDGARIKELIYDYDLYSLAQEEVRAELQKVCKTEDSYHAYFDLAAWAAYLWMSGPLGRQWRIENHDAFWLCETQGLAVLHDMSFLSNTHYKILQRAPKTCCVCGLDSYCVEMVYLEGAHRWLCENHLHMGNTLPGSNCGSRFCKYVECFNHPMYGMQHAQIAVHKQNGMLAQRLRAPEKLLLANP